MEALVIANQYGDFGNARLNGCFNDAENMITNFLKIHPRMKITYMNDGLEKDSPLYPTKENILRELTKLCQSRNRIKFFSYSGHGTHIQDYNNDEKTINFNLSGQHITETQSLLKDSCLVSNDKTFLNIVTDDELCQCLKHIKRWHYLYSFLDCCHSGTGLDLAYVNMANFPTRPTHWNNIQITKGNYPNKTTEIQGNVILLSGTRDKDYAYEYYINGKPQGIFTYALTWFLNKKASRFSLEDFYQIMVYLINNPNQVPVLTCSKNYNLKRFRMSHLTLRRFRPDKRALLRLLNKRR